MSGSLHFTDEINKGLEVYLDGITVIGRIPNLIEKEGKTYVYSKLLYRHQNQEQLKYLIDLYQNRNLEVVVEPEEQRKISRLQCIITPEQDYWVIYDMNSLLGTYVNGKKLETFQKKVLRHMDSIEFCGSDIEALVSAIFRNDPVGKNYAYMICDPTGDLKINRKEGRLLKKELEARGFEITHLEKKVSCSDLESNLQDFIDNVPKDGIFVFIYAGHGNEDGTIVLSDKTYKYETLFNKLEPLKGRSIFFISSCFSGTAIQSNFKFQNSFVVTSTVPDKVSTAGALMNSLRRVLEKNKDSLELSYIADKLVKDGKYKNRFGPNSPQIGKFCSRAVIRSRVI